MLFQQLTTGALGTGFYRQHVVRLTRETATLAPDAALAQLRAKGGVSKGAVVVLALLGLAAGAGAAYYGWQHAKPRAVSDDPFFRGATSGPGAPQAAPNIPTPGLRPNGEIDEEALRNALEEARNLIEQQGVTPDQLPDVPVN